MAGRVDDVSGVSATASNSTDLRSTIDTIASSPSTATIAAALSHRNFPLLSVIQLDPRTEEAQLPRP